MENSFFYACFAFIAAWLKRLYQSSFCAVIAGGVSRTLGALTQGSRVYGFLFRAPGDDKFLKKSAVGRLADGLRGLLARLSKIPWESSLIVSAATELGKSFIYINVRNYLYFIFPFVLMGLLLGSGSGIAIITAVLAAFGVVCWLLNKSPAVMLRSSFIARLICDFFGYDITTLNPSTLDKPGYAISALAIGIMFGVASKWVGLLLALLAAVAFIGAITALYKTEVGIFAAAFLIPLLPTKLILAIALVTVASYLIKVVFGGLRFEFRLMDFFVLAYMLLLLYSLFISYIPSDSLFMVGCYVLFIMFFFAVKNTLKTPQKLFAAITLMIVSAFCVALIGVAQRFFGLNVDIESWIDATMFEDSLQRIYATLGNPNVLGEYLLLMIPLALGAVYWFDGMLKKTVALAMLLVMAACMVFTQSRGAWLGLIAALAVFFMLRDKRFIVIGIIAVILLIPFIPPAILDRFYSIGNTTDSSTAYRVSIWQSSVKLLKDFWPIGIAPGTNGFMFVFQRYAYSAAYAQHSHNLFLQVMIDTGIAGFVLFISYITVFYKNLLGVSVSKAPGLKTNTFVKTLSAALAAGVTGYLVQGMTDNTWYNYRMVMLFWMIMALSSVIREQAHD